MSRFPIHTVEDAPPASTDALAALKGRMGRVLNIHGSMAHAPALISAYAGLHAGLAEHASFDAKTTESIALAVGNANSCDYCQAAHTAGAKAAGLTIDETISIRRGEVDDPKLRALLTLVRQVSIHIGEVDDVTWKTAIEAGWSDEELGEAFAQVIANLFTNYFNHFNHTPLDIPEAPVLD